MHLIFDFDGTLVNSFKCILDYFDSHAKDWDLKTANQEEIAIIRDLSSKEIIKHLKIPFYQLPKMMFQVKKYLRNEVKHLEPSVDIFSTLQALREGDNTLSILTSNSLENVELWLKKQKMRHFFAYIKAESAFFSKKKSLRQFIKLLKLNPAETFYIGDETRDIEAAKGNQLISIAVSWGFNSEKALIKAKPDYIIHRPQELLMIVKNRSNVEMS